MRYPTEKSDNPHRKLRVFKNSNYIREKMKTKERDTKPQYTLLCNSTGYSTSKRRYENQGPQNSKTKKFETEFF